MIRAFNIFISFLISMPLCLAPTLAYAGEVMPEGTTLTEESYVFTIEEATELMQRLDDLEVKEKELEQYRELEEVRLQQIDLFKINLDYSQQQIDRYMAINDMNQDLIDRYNKRDRLQTWENIGFLALGMSLTVGAFLAADAITDHMETTGPSVSF